MENDLLYRLALSSVPGIGPVYAKRLLNHFGEASAIFRASPSSLAKVGGIAGVRANAILHFDQFPMLEKELAFLEKYSIRCLFFTDKDYPQRLLCCKDAPVLLFYKGKADLNARRIISVIGTRTPTEYGKQATERLIKELAPFGPIIVSGLAYGIDAASHKAALKNLLPTIGVLGHGLDRIYPQQHAALAREMLRQGGLLTEFATHTDPGTYNFPVRNRIVAGMSDALVVVETATRGGSMLTVKNALDYQKKIFAFPGRITDTRSSGCNALIRNGKARLLLSGSQLMQEMEWEQPAAKPGTKQAALFPAQTEEASLSDNERNLLHLFGEKESLSVDELSARTGLNSSALAMFLLNLELRGSIQSLPGKTYRLTG